MTYAWPEEAKERGYRIIARLCGNEQRKHGKRLCLTEEQCAKYAKYHEEGA